jgi:hypothetical protein
MYQRGVSVEDVRVIVDTGETIEDYPEDFPHPSRLVLGWRGGRSLHVVVAESPDSQEIFVITVYEPDPGRWSHDFRKRLST